jgi:hypothetical protein
MWSGWDASRPSGYKEENGNVANEVALKSNSWDLIVSAACCYFKFGE